MSTVLCGRKPSPGTLDVLGGINREVDVSDSSTNHFERVEGEKQPVRYHPAGLGEYVPHEGSALLDDIRVQRG